MAEQETATGPDPYDVVFAAVAERGPRDVLEVGGGRGELAERMSRELSGHVIALDESGRMVELTAAWGRGNHWGRRGPPVWQRELRLRGRRVDALHRVRLNQALEELRRGLTPYGRLVAATSSERNLAEVWELVGEVGAPGGGSRSKVPRLLCVDT